MARRPPDWSIYAALTLALVAFALSRREPRGGPQRADAAAWTGGPIAAASPFDPAIVIKTAPGEERSARAGTAFSVSSLGLWVTARHVVEGCRQVGVMTRPDTGVEARVLADPRLDIAVLVTAGGAPGLPLALESPLRVGERGFHPGFPQGRPGEAATRLLGRRTLVLHASRRLRGARAEPVLAWAEVEGVGGGLDGLSGAPVLDARGHVVGLTLAEAPRRGRVYTASPESLAQALDRLGVRPDAPVGSTPALTLQSYGAASEGLRRALQVVQVRCLRG